MTITPQQARAELSRRELTRRGVAVRAPTQPRRLDRAAAGVEQDIAERPSAIGQMRKDPLGFFRQIVGPDKPPFPISAIGPTAALAQEGIEGAISSAGLGIQQRKPLNRIGADMLASVKGERPARLADIPRAAGVPGVVAEPIGFLAAMGFGGLGKGTPARKIGQAAEAVAETMGTKMGQSTRRVTTPVKDAFAYRTPFGTKLPQTPEQLRVLSETEGAKLPNLERGEYLTQQTQSMKDLAKRTFEAEDAAMGVAQRQAKEALAREHLQVQQDLATKRLDFKARLAETQQALNQQRTEVGRSMPQVAANRLESLHTPFRALAKTQNSAYAANLDDALANAEQGGGPVTFTLEDLNQHIGNKYLRPKMAGSPELLIEDPIHYQAMTELLSETGIINQSEISARQLLNIADRVYQQVGAAAKQGARAYTPREVVSQHLRDMLLDMLEQKGVDIRSVKAEWGQWVPLRNLGLKLQQPSGPRQLISIVKGQDPVRAKQLTQLEALLGESLDTETRKVWGQLDNLKQQKVIEQAKQIEFDRLMAQEQGAYRGQKLTKERALTERSVAERQGLTQRKEYANQVIGESEAARKIRVEQRARHFSNIRKLVYLAGAATLAGTQTPAGKTFLKVINPLN